MASIANDIPLQVPFLVARYAGKSELILKLRDAVRAHQNTSDALQFSIALAHILERVVLGSSVMVSLYYLMIFGAFSCLPVCLFSCLLHC